MSVPVIIAFVVALLVEIVLPFVAAFWVEAKLDVPWRAFWYGALVFGMAQLAVRLPLLSLLGERLSPTDDVDVVAVLVWIVILAGTTALVELAGRYLGYRFFFRDLGRTWQLAVMFGLGMAALESLFLVGLQTLLTFVNGLSLPGLDPTTVGLTAEQLASIKAEFAALSPLAPLTAALNAVLELLLQVALAVLVVQAFIPAAPDRADAPGRSRAAGRTTASERARPAGRLVSPRWLWYSLALQFGIGLAVTVASTYSTTLVAMVVLVVAVGGACYWALRLRPAPALKDKLRS